MEVIDEHTVGGGNATMIAVRKHSSDVATKLYVYV